MFCAEPSCNDPPTDQFCEERGLLSNERKGEVRFFVEVGIFTKRGVATCFLVASDALNATDGVLIKNVVVADPQFEWKAGANRNETVKVPIVTERPWKAAKNNQR